MRRVVLAALLLLPGCYRSHELTPAAPPRDAGVTDALVADAPMVCEALGTYTAESSGGPLGGFDDLTLHYFGAEGDAVADTLTFHFDQCSPHLVRGCIPFDVVVEDEADLAASLPYEEGLVLPIEWHDGHFYGTDGTRSVSVYFRRLPSSASDPALRISPGPIECSDVCNDYRGLHVEGFGTSFDLVAGDTLHRGPIVARMSSAYENVCLRCGCTLPDDLATGIIYAFH